MKISGHLFLFLLLTALLTSVAAASATADDIQKFHQHISKGRAHYDNGKNDDAIREFQAAVKLQPNDSWAHLWLGRALGRKAEKAHPVRAAFMVDDVKRELERAVQLDAHNLEAHSDLVSFYLDAPAIFGGGIDKARKQADEMAKIDAAEGHSAKAKIAEKQKKYDVAEHELRAAIAAKPSAEGYRRDLEQFLQRRAGQQAAR